VEIYRQAIVDAVRLLATADRTTWQVILLSLSVSGSAVAIAALIGIPFGYALGMSRHAGRGVIMLLVNTAMGFPPVVVGLFVYMAFSRSGPMGMLDLLYTPTGMVVAQVILATPLVIGVSAAAIASVPRDLRIQLRALGASRLQEGLAILKEARGGVMASVVVGFGGIISEVGAVSIVGGGIEGHTDVMTTAIMANVSRGENSKAMAWAFVLIGIALSVNVVLTFIQSTSTRHGG
jgi:tungstate transport system permease protein